MNGPTERPIDYAMDGVASPMVVPPGGIPVGELSDERLIEAYQSTSGEPGDAEADALLAEIERRGLEV